MNTKVTSSKDELVDMARNYYRDNTKALKLVDSFYQSYRSNDAFRWCFRSPFPSRSLNDALRSHNSEKLDSYSFLLNDTSRVLKQQHKRNSGIQVYKGMKVSSDLVNKLDRHAGELICTNGFFICTKSRTAAWAHASSSRRLDLSSVLFYISCDPSVPFANLPTHETSGQIVFNIYTTFRVMHVSRGQLSVVKMKTAGEEGRQMAREYKNNHKGENIQTLLDELLGISKLSAPSLSSLSSLANMVPVEIR
jgi:hypothetical protein